MKSRELLEQIKNLSNEEKRNINYDKLKEVMNDMTADEIIELSNIIGYPVFTRMCMGELKHKFVLLQDGAAAIIVNNEGKILLQRRADKDVWGLPGGCQELGESFKDTVIREIKEETNLDIEEKDLELIDIVSGKSRRNSYPNGDVVINNTALYCIKKYTGELKWDEESKEMKFFDLNELPENQNDPDLIKRYIEYKKNLEIEIKELEEKLIEKIEVDRFEEQLENARKDRLIEISDWWGHKYHGKGGYIVTNKKEVYEYREYFNQMPKDMVDRIYISKVAKLSGKDINKITKFIEKEIVGKEFEFNMIFDAGFDVIVNYNNEEKVIKNNTDFDKKNGVYDKAKKLLMDIIKNNK